MRLYVWFLVAGLPLVTGAGLLLRDADPTTWSTLTRPALWRLAADALLLNTTLVVLAAPVWGVAMGCAWWRMRHSTSDAHARTLRRLLVVSGLFLLSSVVVTTAGFGLTVPALQLVAAAHLTLGAAALALGAVGAWCAGVFRDPLDAVACSLVVAVVTSFGVLLAGPLVQHLSYGTTNAALLASPLVATAAAAHIDILRTELFYQISPLAHRRFDYPVWHVASTVYLTIAVLCFGGIIRAVTYKGRLQHERVTRV